MYEAGRQECETEVTANVMDRFERRLTEEISTVRDELRAVDGRLREQIRELDTAVRLDMRDMRFEILKWSFGFWIGQVIATAAIVGGMLQLTIR